jgi:DNA methylase
MSSQGQLRLTAAALRHAPTASRKTSELSQAAKRWAAVGPYYAMIPIPFVLEQIERFTVRGDVVFDPFCGRGTIPYAAATLGRPFFGIEIFPVGWVYSATKCDPASASRVIKRLGDIGAAKPSSVEESEFFRLAYTPRTLRFLCAAREHLDWRNSTVDRTLMALLLICLHDKSGAGLSNQMRQTKAMHPSYAVRWWRRHRKFAPPESDPVELLKEKIVWRYAKGMAKGNAKGRIYLGDCTRVIPTTSRIEKVKLLFTSPPYCGVTNYYVDQWLRNWMLGGPPRPCSGAHASMKRFENKEAYRSLLERTFRLAAQRLRDDAVIIVRTDARDFTLQVTREILRKIFPTKHLVTKLCPLRDRFSQTALFGDTQEKPGEVDLFLR